MLFWSWVFRRFFVDSKTRMNLYFRLISLLLKLMFHKRQAPLEVTSRAFRVWPFDCDINFHMNNGRYLTLMDLGRIDLMAKVGLLKPALKRGWMPVVGKIHMHYYKSLDPFQKFHIDSRVVYWDEKWIYLEQCFRVKDTVVAKGMVQALFLKGKDKVHPNDVINALDKAIEKPKAPDWDLIKK